MPADASIHVQLILGSSRQERQGDKVARWALARASARPDFGVELLDLRDWPLPFFDEPRGPMGRNGRFPSPAVERWVNKVAEADAYVCITPEYNHSFTAVLKNALDHAYAEWNHKPVTFIGYSGGAAAGIRAVEQLRLVAIELQMAPIRAAVQIAGVRSAFDEQGNVVNDLYNQQLQALFDQLLWWARALKNARLAITAATR